MYYRVYVVLYSIYYISTFLYSSTYKVVTITDKKSNQYKTFIR